MPTYTRLALAALLPLSGCAASAPRPDAGAAIAAALGFESAIAIRSEASAVDDPAPLPGSLSLRLALERTLYGSPELQAALARVRLSFAEADQARLLPNPILELVLRFPEGGGKTIIETGVSAEVAALLGRRRRVSAADHRVNAAVAAALDLGIDLAAELQTTYATVQALDRLAAVLAERSRLLAELLRLARARMEAGEIGRVDLLAIETQGLELEAEIAERDADRTSERLHLAALIGVPSAAATWNLEPFAPRMDIELDEARLVGIALGNRPEIQALRWELLALGDEAGVARLSLLAGAAAGAEAERDDDWSVGPGASIPLPLFDSGRARADAARARVIEARHELLGAERRAIEEVRALLASHRAAQANLARVRDRLLPLEEERRRQIEAIYLAGQADLTALLLAEQDLQKAQTTLVELERRSTTSLLRLQQALGGVAATRRTGAPASPTPENGGSSP